MGKALEPYLTLQYLFGVVVAGILINIISHYVLKHGEGFMSKVFKKWGERTKKRKAARELIINSLVNNQDSQRYYSFRAVVMSVYSTQLLIMSVLLFVVRESPHQNSYMRLIVSLLLIGVVPLGMLFSFAGMDYWDIVREARKMEIENK